MFELFRLVRTTFNSWFTRRKQETIRRRPERTRLALESLEERINPNTTLNPLGSGLQILIADGDTVNLSTTSGCLVINDATPGQTIADNTAKFTLTGAAGNQTATENAGLASDFASITVSGTGGAQTVNFIGGTFIATNINDGTIATVGLSVRRQPSSAISTSSRPRPSRKAQRSPERESLASWLVEPTRPSM